MVSRFVTRKRSHLDRDTFPQHRKIKLPAVLWERVAAQEVPAV